MSQALQVLTEIVIENTFDPDVIFNDLSLHAFDPATLKASASTVGTGAEDNPEGGPVRVTTCMWVDPTEPPRMEESELITNSQ